MNLYLVRHGESKGNVDKLHEGHDEGLTGEGSRQAHAVAKRFDKIRVDYILSSTLIRARQTAEIINRRVKKPIEHTELLSEVKRPSELAGREEDDPQAQRIWKLLQENYHDETYRYSDEETFEDFKWRVTEFLSYSLTLNRDNILCVTHGITLRMIVSLTLFGENLNSYEFEKIASHLSTINTGITICTFEEEEAKWKLLTWNDHAHLGE